MIYVRDFPRGVGPWRRSYDQAEAFASELRPAGYHRAGFGGDVRPGEFAVTLEHERGRCTGCAVKVNPLPGGWDQLTGQAP